MAQAVSPLYGAQHSAAQSGEVIYACSGALIRKIRSDSERLIEYIPARDFPTDRVNHVGPDPVHAKAYLEGAASVIYAGKGTRVEKKIRQGPVCHRSADEEYFAISGSNKSHGMKIEKDPAEQGDAREDRRHRPMFRMNPGPEPVVAVAS